MDKIETKARRRLLNALMALAIGVIILSGIMITGKLKGWFRSTSESYIKAGEITGICNIERQGVGYSLKENAEIQAADTIETKKGSTAALTLFTGNRSVMNAEAEMKVEELSGEALHLTIPHGEVFFDISDPPKDLIIRFGKNTAQVKASVFSVSVQQGSASLYVFDGSVDITAEDGTYSSVQKGKFFSIAQSGDGALSVEGEDLPLHSLNAFMIKCCRGSENKNLFFDDEALKKLEKERQEEKTKLAQGTNEQGGEASEGGGDKVCYITILCDSILNNMGNLTPGKEQFVPSNGVILGRSEVSFSDGETVFDVLTRVCANAGIQIEYSWTPMYGSYYIEGINNLYEFDCGHESGWRYKVNGWSPNYGCSSYKVEASDEIVWYYTCKGLGGDGGGPVG